MLVPHRVSFIGVLRTADITRYLDRCRIPLPWKFSRCSDKKRSDACTAAVHSSSIQHIIANLRLAKLPSLHISGNIIISCNNSLFVHVLIYVPNNASTLLMPGIEVGIEDRYFCPEASSLLYSVSHSLPNPADWRTAAPCRNN